VLQIGAYKSEAEATAAFNALKAKNGAVMSGYSPNIRQVDLGAKGTWYRLRVGSFGDKDSATALCSRLGGGCFPAKP
jgi:cell division protein FtsN